MDAVAFTSLDELIERISRRRAIELFDDDGDGAILAGAGGPGDLEAFDRALASVNDEVVSMLYRKGFTATQVAALAADASLRRCATDLLAQQAGERRSEFLDGEGRGPFHGMGERARAQLRLFTTGELRSRLEDTIGPNPTAVAQTANVAGEQALVFTVPGRTVGPGGF